MIEPLQIIYYVAGIIAICGTGIAWVWKHFDSRDNTLARKQEVLQEKFDAFRLHAGEKFATVEAVVRIEQKIDQMSDRMNRTLLSLFSGKNLKGSE